MGDDFLALIQEAQTQAESDESPLVQTVEQSPNKEQTKESVSDFFKAKTQENTAPAVKEPEPQVNTPPEENTVEQPSTDFSSFFSKGSKDAEPAPPRHAEKIGTVEKEPVTPSVPKLEPLIQPNSAGRVDADTVERILSIDSEFRSMTKAQQDVMRRLTAGGGSTDRYAEAVSRIANVDSNVVRSVETVVALTEQSLDERAFTVVSLSDTERSELMKVLSLFSEDGSHVPGSLDKISESRLIVRAVSSMGTETVGNVKIVSEVLKRMAVGH